MGKIVDGRTQYVKQYKDGTEVENFLNKMVNLFDGKSKKTIIGIRKDFKITKITMNNRKTKRVTRKVI